MFINDPSNKQFVCLVVDVVNVIKNLDNMEGKPRQVLFELLLIYQFVLKILNGNKMMTSIKGNNSVEK